jgi:hypothetical protein
MGAQLGFQGGMLGRDDGARATGALACRQRAGPFQASDVLLDRREGNPEGAGGLGLGHPLLDRPHDPLAQVLRVWLHARSILPAVKLRQLL